MLTQTFCLHFSAVLISLVVTLGSTAAVAIADEPPPTLAPLFNGQDLSGWVLTNTPPDTWSFRDGVLVCTGKPIGELRTAKMYQNFVMELEWRHLVPRGNAGLFVWADDIPARGVPFHRGIEVQILENAYGNSNSHTTHGDIFPIHGATMEPINGRGGSRAFPTEMRSKPSPEWNHYRVECRDGEITLAVNGTVVTRGKNASPRKGYLCLESEGGVVEYRNIKIAELPGDSLPEDQIAIADRGYRSIYSGLDLRGWTSPAAMDRWKVSDWILQHAARDGESQLEHDAGAAIVRFVVDVRFADEQGQASISIGNDAAIDLAHPDVKAALQSSGKWNRVEATLGADGWQVTVNGSQIKALVQNKSENRSQLSLRATGAVEFCNVFIKTDDR